MRKSFPAATIALLAVVAGGLQQHRREPGPERRQRCAPTAAPSAAASASAAPSPTARCVRHRQAGAH